MKNLLVFLAPGAAGALGHLHGILQAGAAGLIFALASSGNYLINDVHDIENDRAHPTKRYRPIASGQVSVGLASSLGLLLIVLSIGSAWWLAGRSLALCIVSYVILTTAYSLFFKRVAYVELLIVASGFVLRAIAGGVAVHISISPWFLLVTSTAALLIGTGKRTGELMLLKDQSAAHRSVNRYYSLRSLTRLRVLVEVIATAGYGLWAFSQAARLDAIHDSGDDIFFKLSIAPFVVGLVVLENALRGGDGAEPETLALHNHQLQLAGVFCVGLVAAGVYL
jgi:decaprenyl-phosphate phosphoribosyltransferase